MFNPQASEISGSPGPEAFGVESFCAAHGISRTTFYKLIKTGEAPRLMRVGARILISKESAAAWRAQREQAAAA